MNIRISALALVAGILPLPLHAAEETEQRFEEGVHYTVLDTPVPTRDGNRVEVVKAFSYGCSPCYALEQSIAKWGNVGAAEIDFWQFPAVWNEPMAVLARAFYAAQELGVLRQVHGPLFTAIVVEQRKLSTASELSGFVATLGVDSDAFMSAYLSSTVRRQVEAAERKVRSYNLASAPEFIVNGKYRVDRMRAGGLTEMLDVVDFLVQRELSGSVPASTAHNTD